MRRVVVDAKEIEKHKCGPRPQRARLCPRSKSVAAEVTARLAGWDERVAGDFKLGYLRRCWRQRRENERRNTK
jgi:hypothetical protein